MPDVNPQLLEVRVADQPDCTVVECRGEIDLLSAPTLASALERATGGQQVIVDLAGVTFIGSAGLAALINSRRQLGAEGRTLVLRRPRPQARRLLAALQLDVLFAIEGNHREGRTGPSRPD